MGSGFITSAVINGLGRHEYYLTPTQQKNLVALDWTDFVQLMLNCLMIKISICLFLLRIVNSKSVTRAVYWFIAAMTIFTMVTVFLLVGICRPLGAWWSTSVQGTCFSKKQFMNIIIAHGGMCPMSRKARQRSLLLTLEKCSR